MPDIFQGELFSQEELENLDLCNREIAVKAMLKKRTEFYKTAPLPYFEQPANDAERFLNCQYRYLKYDEQKAWEEMGLIAYELFWRLLWKRMREGKAGKKRLTKSDQIDVISKAYCYVMRRYLPHKNNALSAEDLRNIEQFYFVKRDVTGFLDKGLKHALFYRTKKDTEQSLEELYSRKRGVTLWQM